MKTIITMVLTILFVSCQASKTSKNQALLGLLFVESSVIESSTQQRRVDSFLDKTNN